MGEELPSQRLVKIKLGEVSALDQITQQGLDLKQLRDEKKQFHGENKQFREENKQFRKENKQLDVRLVELVEVTFNNKCHTKLRVIGAKLMKKNAKGYILLEGSAWDKNYAQLLVSQHPVSSSTEKIPIQQVSV